MNRLFSWVVLLTLSCAPYEASPEGAPAQTGASKQEIIGGTIAYQDPAVVAVAAGSNQYCTGTLIAPRTVLTAAHCIGVYGNQAPYFVEFGTDSSNPTRRVRVSAQYAHPNYSGQIRDIGILRLDSAVTDIAPIPLNTVPFKSSDIGRDIRHVGFGITNAATGAGGGIKREVTYSLRRFDSWLLESGGSGKQTCSGDSGGPALMTMGNSSTEVLVGVVSWGDQDCRQLGVDARVDADIQWIRNTMAGWEAPSCERDGRCVENCGSPDQDCVCVENGVCDVRCENLLDDADCPKDCAPNNVCSAQACPVPDVDCVEVGAVCESNLDCVSRSCIDDPQSGGATYCTKRCTTASECPSGMECNSNNECQFIQRPEKGLGDVCSLTDFCRGGLCTAPADEARRCAKVCLNDASCPSGYTCETGIDDIRFCRSPTPVQSMVVLPLAPQSLTAASGCQSTSGGTWAWLLVLAGGLLRRRRSA